MILRSVRKEDLVGIARLYKVCYNITMNRKSYDFWYLRNGKYTSLICELDGDIIGHNALIEQEYLYEGIPIKVALSAAGMVTPEYKKPGLFLKLLDHSISNYKGDCIIAFPNKNAEPFWCRILKFNTIADNYFYITPEFLNNDFNEELQFKLTRPAKFLKERTKTHPKYSYEKKEFGSFNMITKEYNGNIELVYINQLSPEIVPALKSIFDKGYTRINVISIYKEQIEKLGFVLGKHNVFVYKWLNDKYMHLSFECQMIDSDVF